MRSAQSYPDSSNGRHGVPIGFDLIKALFPEGRSFVACISSRITTVIQVKLDDLRNHNRSNEPFAVSLCKSSYLDMHGLIFETSICYWKDQPDRPDVEPATLCLGRLRPESSPTGGSGFIMCHACGSSCGYAPTTAAQPFEGTDGRAAVFLPSGGRETRGTRCLPRGKHTMSVYPKR